jgi:F0F1-type ATP synthase membrane subunit b/b'
MENLGIDVKLIIAQSINFLVFFLIYKKFIANGFLKFLNEEKKKSEIIASLDQEITKKREELLEEKKQLKYEVKKEVEALRRSLMEEINEEKKKILENAKKEAALFKERSKKQIEEEQVKMQTEFKKKISDFITLAIESAFKDFLDEKQEKEIMSRVFKNLKKTVN